MVSRCTGKNNPALAKKVSHKPKKKESLGKLKEGGAGMGKRGNKEVTIADDGN